MKTAMQELIDNIESSQQRYVDLAKSDKKLKKGVDAILTATTIIKIKAKLLLEKEKQQIIDAYHSGCSDWDNELSNGDKYYNETFKND